MKRIIVLSGSRADAGMLEWPLRILRDSFDVMAVNIAGDSVAGAFESASEAMRQCVPHCLLILGDRYEILAAAIAAHLRRVPIAHICGGDVSLGSYDDAMRDCISRLAWIHFPSSHESAARLQRMGYDNVHMVGSTGVDYIMHADWRKSDFRKAWGLERPYVVVSYQAETIDGTIEWDKVLEAVDGREAVYLFPNPDAGSKQIKAHILAEADKGGAVHFHESLPHDDFLNLIANCEELIGNSSAMLYEAPFLDVKTRMIGKRQQGRVIPIGEGNASERIRDILMERL